MARSYTDMKLIESEIHEMRAKGKTRSEIAKHFGLNIIDLSPTEWFMLVLERRGTCGC